MSSCAGFNPHPFDLACVCRLLHHHHSDRRLPQFSDVHGCALVRTFRVFDFLAIAFGKVSVFEGAAQVSSFLAFGLHQVRFDEPTYRCSVRAAKIRRADGMRFGLGIHRFILPKRSAGRSEVIGLSWPGVRTG